MTSIDATTATTSACQTPPPLSPLQQLEVYRRRLDDLTDDNNKLFIKYVKALKGERRATTTKQASYYRRRAKELRTELSASYTSIRRVQKAMAVLQHSLQFPGGL